MQRCAVKTKVAAAKSVREKSLSLSRAHFIELLGNAAAGVITIITVVMIAATCFKQECKSSTLRRKSHRGSDVSACHRSAYGNKRFVPANQAQERGSRSVDLKGGTETSCSILLRHYGWRRDLVGFLFLFSFFLVASWSRRFGWR